MIEISEAIEIIKCNLKPKFSIEDVDILDSIGRVMSKDIFAPIDLPPFNKSPYDGYAYDANIEGDELEIVGESFAGDVFDKDIKKNQCIKIMTGSKIPAQVNCVIKKEDVLLIGNKIKVNKKLKEYENYIFKGEDIKKNQLVIKRGTMITTEMIGILASLGIKEVSVYEELKIAILNTGSEIQSLDSKLEDGRIYDSNRYILLSKLNKKNIKPIKIDRANDDLEELETKMKNLLKDVEILITTGGVSVGDKDLIPKAFNNIGARQLFWKVKTKPGGSCCFSVLDNKLLCGLSGNPHAAIVIYENILSPIIEYLSQKERKEILKAFFQGNYNKISIMDRYINGKLYTEEGKLYVKIADKEKSKLFSSMNSNCMIKVKKNAILENNELVEVIMV